MTKVVEFRAKCIRTYVSNMKKWLNNWELKQEYLVNLRKEFALDHDLLLHHLQKAKEAANAANQPLSDALQAVGDHYAKVAEIYLLGNSFY